MPVFNTDTELLHESVASVLDQDSVSLELLLVDDGSTELPTTAALMRIAQSDTRIRLIRQQQAGVAAARNSGMHAATGDWITFLDPDDILLSINDVLSTLTSTTKDVVVAAAEGVMRGTQTEEYHLNDYPINVESRRVVADLLSLFNFGRQSANFLFGVVWAKFFRRTFVHGFEFDTSLVKRSDAAWLLRVFLATDSIHILNSPAVRYRAWVDGSISRKYRPDVLETFIRLGRMVSEVQDVQVEVRELYYVELVKDAINTIFTNPSAPRDTITKAHYLRYRNAFTIEHRLLRSGALAPASVSRKALYVIIKMRWFAPIQMLLTAKQIRAKIDTIRRRAGSTPRFWRR